MNRRVFLQASSAAALAAQTAAAAANPVIDEARQIAINLLKPSRRDLEYGLGLHADSVVFDSYGFSPRGAIDGDRYAEAVRRSALACSLEPANGKFLVGLGVACFRLQEYEKAIEALARAETLLPRSDLKHRVMCRSFAAMR